MNEKQEITTINAENKSIVQSINSEINLQLNTPEVKRALLATTFKGLKDEKQVKQALMEGMLRGWSFTDFMKKRVYAIPFKQGYSLVQAIEDVRSIAMKSGQVGKDAPIYTETENGRIETCTVSVYRMINGYVGKYTATVYFKEYDKGANEWKNKPRTMIAKVAEMHALRMAFPEELENAYVEEEFQQTTRFSQYQNDSESLKISAITKQDNDENQEVPDTYPVIQTETDQDEKDQVKAEDDPFAKD